MSPALVPVSALSKASPQISRGTPCKDDAPSDQPQDHQSRLKFIGGAKNSSLPLGSGSGRSTPSLGRSGSLLLKSGLARPSSRLSKQGEQHRSLDDLDADDEDNVEKGVPIPLTRKGSDGAVKKHKVAGSASLPRQLSKVAPDYSMFSSPAGNGTLSSSESEVGAPEDQLCCSLDSHTKQDEPSGRRTLKMPSKVGGGVPVPGTTPATTSEKPPLAVEGSGEEEDVKHARGSIEEARPASRLQMMKPGGAARELRPPGERKVAMPMPRAVGKDAKLMATMALTAAALTSENVTGSNSSLDSCSGSADIQAAESSKLDMCMVAENPSKVLPLQKKGLPMPSTVVKLTASDLITSVSPAKDTAVTPPGAPGGSDDTRGTDKDIPSPVATPSPRCIRRISPEGMSHEETQSPSEVSGAIERVQAPSEKEIIRTDITGERDCSVEKKMVEASDSKKSSVLPVCITSDPKGVEEGSNVAWAQGKVQAHPSLPLSQAQLPGSISPTALPGNNNATAITKPVDTPAVADRDLLLPSAHIPRIDQLSGSTLAPKRARSLSPARPSRSDVSHDYKEPSSLAAGDSGEQRPLSTSSSGSIGGDSTKSDMAPVAKPLRSSLKSSANMRRNMANGSDSSLEKVQHRVTISPRESQIEYMSDHPIVTLSHTASQMLAVTRSPGVVRRASVRSEKLTYSEEESFLRPKLQQAAQDKMASTSTPQVHTPRVALKREGEEGRGHVYFYAHMYMCNFGYCPTLKKGSFTLVYVVSILKYQYCNMCVYMYI